jgi:hypothetical protein
MGVLETADLMVDDPGLGPADQAAVRGRDRDARVRDPELAIPAPARAGLVGAIPVRAPDDPAAVVRGRGDRGAKIRGRAPDDPGATVPTVVDREMTGRGNDRREGAPKRLRAVTQPVIAPAGLESPARNRTSSSGALQ